MLTQASPLSLATTLKELTEIAFFASGESKRRPISRFTANTVFSGLVTACRLAIWPTSRSSESVNATIEGVVRAPSLLGITTGSPPSITETQLLVVPRSMPITFAIGVPAPSTSLPQEARQQLPRRLVTRLLLRVVYHDR